MTAKPPGAGVHALRRSSDARSDATKAPSQPAPGATVGKFDASRALSCLELAVTAGHRGRDADELCGAASGLCRPTIVLQGSSSSTRPSRDPRHRGSRRDVARDDGAGADEGARADTNPAEDHGTRADRRPALDDGRSNSQSSAVCSSPAVVRRGRALVVDEHDAVPDEDLVLDRDAVADERVALDLAARADRGAALDLDERADSRVVADRAAVEVREACTTTPSPNVTSTSERNGASLAGVSATRRKGRHGRDDMLDLASRMPGKIGSERHSRASASATGKLPSASRDTRTPR